MGASVRLPAKEQQLVAILRDKPQTLGELTAAGSFASRKIGAGYLRPILKCLLDEGKIAVTNGIFWARPSEPGKPCALCGQPAIGFCPSCFHKVAR